MELNNIERDKNKTLLTPRSKIWICLFINGIVLCIVSAVVIILRDDASSYFRIGPNDDLIVVSVRVNTISRYLILLSFICLIRISEVFVNELATPVLGFSIYNPDKKVITEFGKNELQLYANTMFGINAIRDVFMIVITVTQIDLALLSTIVSQVTTFFTIRILLNEKKFISSSFEETPYNLLTDLSELE